MVLNRKLVILIGLFTIILIVMSVSLFLINMTPDSTSPTPTPSRPSPIVSKVPEKTPVGGQQPTLPVGFTGVSTSGNDLPAEQQKQVNQAFDLRQKLPVNQIDFIIEYDYSEDIFIVSLKQPTVESRQKFDIWLSTNNFESIPTSRFQFKSM